MRLRSLALIAALLLAACGRVPAQTGPAVFVGSYDLTIAQEWFGGFSGFDTPDGRTFAMISDRGFLVTGSLLRLGERIIGIGDRVIRTFEPPEGGWPMIGGEKIAVDTEGLVLDGGDLFVSFEVIHEVWRYSLTGGTPVRLPSHPDFAALRYNGSFEALAMDGNGDLVVLPERPERWGRGFHLWRWDGSAWRRDGRLPDRDRYRAVGADFGPDGRLYLLERRLGLWGFASRIRSFAYEDGGWTDEGLVLESEAGRHGNLEGLAVWRDAGGRLRLTMTTDNNFKWFQRNELVEYAVPE
ncbi:esterase-like activity of phytase family protein [Roseitranquillus sediminis]|uniref:esterase-like activity of phytase family protein n=1 Tax=Roseitranquillus sediminis TaxID=2809051 RepID=UPI001D0CA219|nr:esterase-like activity of phytase family protein [Roseitranquillus sediminis]MBM9596154.1 esterase-like activity of phytase family protein [Roseitranquillus sediminis]